MFNFLHLLGSLSADNGYKKAVIIGPPSGTVSISLLSREQEKTPRGFPVCAGMEDLYHSQSPEAYQKNYSPDITGVYTKARLHTSADDSKPQPRVKIAHGPHSKLADSEDL